MPSVMLNMTLKSTHLEQKLISLEIKQQPLVPVRKKAPKSSKVRGNSKIPRKFKPPKIETLKVFHWHVKIVNAEPFVVIE